MYVCLSSVVREGISNTVEVKDLLMMTNRKGSRNSNSNPPLPPTTTTMATNKKAAAQTTSTVSTGLTFAVDETVQPRTMKTYHGQIIIPTGKALAFQPSMKIEGMVNVVFTGFDPENPAQGETYGFHLTEAEGEAFAQALVATANKKREEGLNPNAVVFSFKSFEGSYIAGSDLYWFNSKPSEFTLHVGIEGPKKAGSSVPTKEQAQQKWSENNQAAAKLRELDSPSAAPNVRLTAAQRLQERLAAMTAQQTNQAVDMGLSSSEEAVKELSLS